VWFLKNPLSPLLQQLQGQFFAQFRYFRH
jgi:hypothetical protein